LGLVDWPGYWSTSQSSGGWLRRSLATTGFHGTLTSFVGAVVSDVDGLASSGMADDARDRLRFTVSGDDADDSTSPEDSADSDNSRDDILICFRSFVRLHNVDKVFPKVGQDGD